MYEAKVTFWGQDKGGRFSTPQPGFRPQIEIDDVQTSCIVDAQDTTVKVFEFDKSYVVNLKLMYQEVYAGKLKFNDPVRLFEGSKQIAEGTITKTE